MCLDVITACRSIATFLHSLRKGMEFSRDEKKRQMQNVKSMHTIRFWHRLLILLVVVVRIEIAVALVVFVVATTTVALVIVHFLSLAVRTPVFSICFR